MIDTQPLIDRADIVSIIGQSIGLKRVGKDYVALCPFHAERSPSFNVVPAKRMFYCHGCGKTGNVITWLMEHQGLSFKEACKELGGVPQRRKDGHAPPAMSPTYIPKPLAWGGPGPLEGKEAILILDDEPDAEELAIARARYPDHDIIWYPHGGATAVQMELSWIAWEKIIPQPLDGYWEQLRAADLIRLIDEYRRAHTKPAG